MVPFFPATHPNQQTWVVQGAGLPLCLTALRSHPPATTPLQYISRFTRLSGELFGMLIALLFLQQAVKGSVEEFRSSGSSEGAAAAGASAGAAPPADAATWQLINGLWSLLLAFGLLLSCMLVRTARSWRFLRAPLR